jgi:cytochrome P450
MVYFDPYDRDYADNPYPVYKQLRDEAPVYHSPERNFWALSRYEDVREAHRDFATWSSAGGVTIEGYDKGAPVLIVKAQGADHQSLHRPAHGRTRALCTQAVR